MRSFLLASLLLGLAVRPALAQDPRLVQRLGAAAADSIAGLVAAAEREGLPGPALTAKALEGAGRGAPAARVLQAVTNLAAALRGARAALGTHDSPDELTAGAAALQNGVPPEVLRRLAQSSAARPVTTPLVVLTDLVARGVPRDTISTLVSNSWQRGISEQALLRLRETISRDIAAGTSPADAALLRLQAFSHGPAPTPGAAQPSEARP